MTGFLAGLVTGCLVGVTLTIVFLLFAATWLVEPQQQPAESSLRGIAAASLIILSLCGLSYALHLPKGVVMILLLSAVFLIADQLEILTSLIAAGLSTIMLTILFLPPIRSIRILHAGDRLSLAAFLLVSVVGCRLICGRRLQEVTRGRDSILGN
jgi:K+-sensing histidine kinase KdpD